MKFYRAAPVNTIPQVSVGGRPATRGGGWLPGATAMIAIPLADLVSPAAGFWPRRTGRHWWWLGLLDRYRGSAVFVKVVAVAPALGRGDGRVQAGGHPADHARLGALEQQLDDLLGPGVIDEIAAQAALTGK